MDTIYEGDTLHLAASAYTADGKLVRKAVTWSADTTMLKIDSTGTAIALETHLESMPSITTVTASADGVSGQATVVIYRGVYRAWIVVSRRLLIGRAMPLTVMYSYGYPSVSPAPRVAWTSSDTSVASISNGAGLAKKAGTTLLTARVGGWSDTMRVEVTGAGYTATYLGTLGGSYSRALDINDAGTVVGNSATLAGDTVAFRWQGGAMSLLGSFRLPEGSALIDAQGRVVGTPDLPGPPGGVVTAVSDLGEVAGYWHSNPYTADSAFVVRGGSVYRLSQSNARCSSGSPTSLTNLRVLGRNDAGAVVGAAWAAAALGCSALEPAASWGPGDNATLYGNSYTGLAAAATAVNNSGAYVLWVAQHLTAVGRSRAGLLVQGQTVTALDGGVATRDTYPLDLNDHGQVVGISAVLPWLPHGFVWQSGVLADLSLLTKDTDWEVLEATGVNESGQIVGVGKNNRTGQTGAILLTPTP